MIAQVVLNGFVTGMIIALPAIALTLTYGILKFPILPLAPCSPSAPISHISPTRGCICRWSGLPCLLRSRLPSPALGWIGWCFSRCASEPRSHCSSPQWAYRSSWKTWQLFVLGNSARSFEVAIARPQRFLELRVNMEQIYTAATALCAMLAIYIVLHHTALGRAMRAVSDNPALAAVRGIDRERIARWMWVIAGVLTAIAGVLAGLDRAIDPLLGWNYVVTVFAAAILGGLGNPFGAVLGALTLGVVEETSTLLIPPNYRQVVSFCAIAFLLLARPQGLLGSVRVKR